MAKICFKNVLDGESKFVEVDKDYLIQAVYEYARMSDEEIYKAIMNQRVVIFLNNKHIPVDNWHTTKLDKSDEITVVPEIVGEKVGGFLQIAIGAVLIVGAFMSAGWAAPTAFSFWETMAFSLGVSFALGGISNLLFQPDLPSISGYSGSGGKATQTYNWSGVKTMAQEDTPIPIVYGTHPVGGNVISLFTDRYGDNSYLNMLIALCEGEIEGICQEYDHTSVCSTSDKSDASYKSPAIMIDDQPLRVYDDVEWWYRKGTNTPDPSKSFYSPDYQNKIPYFDGANVQYDDDRSIPANPSYIEYITTKDVDMVNLQFFVPQLYDASGTDITDKEIVFNVQYSTDGNTFYNYGTEGTYKYTPKVSGTRTAYCTCTKYKYDNYVYGDPDPTYTIRVLKNGYREAKRLAIRDHRKYCNPITNYNIVVEIRDSDSNIVETKTITQSFNCWYGRKGSHSHHVHIDDHDNTTFYIGNYAVTLDHDVIAGDEFTISSVESGVQGENISINGITKTGIWKSVILDFNKAGKPGRDTYYLRIKRVDGGKSNDLNISDDLVLKSVIETVHGEYIYPNTALLGLRIRATGQLSGAPPNVVTTLKGLKIAVPDLSGSEAFEDHFWDDTDNRWEYNDAERTWDNTTYTSTKEYCNNSILCVRDLALSSRYGLGDYYTSSDFDTSEIVTAIRECHKRYDPYSEDDYLSWWDSGTDSNWLTWWEFSPKTSDNITKSYSSSARTISIVGGGGDLDQAVDYTVINFRPKTYLKRGQSYDFNITVSSVNNSIDFDLNAKSISNPESLINLGSLSDKNDGTHTITYTVTNGDYYEFELTITGNNPKNASSYTISDMSISKNASSYEHYHTWNGVIESGQSALTVLFEMCDAFRCWPVYHSGKINFVMDRDTTPIQTLSIGNTKEFSQSFMPLSQIPYKLSGQFTDEARKYDLRSLTSKSSMSGLIKLNENTIGLKGITSRAKAERELVFKHNKATNLTNTCSFKCGLDLIHGTAGDIIEVQDDLPQWGFGGNIISYSSTNITIDSPYTFSSNAATYTFTIDYQDLENNKTTATINANASTGKSLQTLPIINLVSSPCDLSSFSINTTNYEAKKFRMISVERTGENEVEISGLEHLSSLYSEVATLTVVKDTPHFNPPSDPHKMPLPPRKASAVPLSMDEGMGFLLSAFPDSNDGYVKDIVVQFDRYNARNFETIGIIPKGVGYTKYFDNTLSFDTSYKFRFFCRTAYKDGPPIEVTSKIVGEISTIDPPSGLHIKGESENSPWFYGKDVTIAWNPVGINVNIDDRVKGYKVEVYKDCIYSSNTGKLNYDNGTGSFHVNDEIKQWDDDGTVLASGIVSSVVDNGDSTGTLSLKSIQGTFQDNKIIGTESYGNELAPLGDCSTDWFDSVETPWIHDAVNNEYDINGSQTENTELAEGSIIASNLYYKVIYEVKNYSQGMVCIISPSYTRWRSANGTYTEIGYGEYNELRVRADYGAVSEYAFIGSVTNFSIKIITNAALANGTLQTVSSNLLRTSFVSTEEYTYTYDANKGDNGGTPSNNIIFTVKTLTRNGIESNTLSILEVMNAAPSAPGGLSTTSWRQSVKFRWTPNTESDFRYYKYRTKVETDSWSSWQK